MSCLLTIKLPKLDGNLFSSIEEVAVSLDLTLFILVCECMTYKLQGASVSRTTCQPFANNWGSHIHSFTGCKSTSLVDANVQINKKCMKCCQVSDSRTLDSQSGAILPDLTVFQTSVQIFSYCPTTQKVIFILLNLRLLWFIADCNPFCQILNVHLSN